MCQLIHSSLRRYSCGSWIANVTIPSFQPSWARQWDGVTDTVQDDTVSILEKDGGPAGLLYRSCMDEEAINKAGAAPLMVRPHHSRCIPPRH